MPLPTPRRGVDRVGQRGRDERGRPALDGGIAIEGRALARHPAERADHRSVFFRLRRIKRDRGIRSTLEMTAMLTFGCTSDAGMAGHSPAALPPRRTSCDEASMVSPQGAWRAIAKPGPNARHSAPIGAPKSNLATGAVVHLAGISRTQPTSLRFWDVRRGCEALPGYNKITAR